MKVYIWKLKLWLLTLKKHLILQVIWFFKAFDSFLLACLEKYLYVSHFIKWVEILLESHESCIINGGNMTKNFKLKKGAFWHPFSLFLFISCL